MTFPLAFTVGLHSYTAGADDGYGNPTRTYTPPLDQSGTSYKVVGWADLPLLPAQAEESGNRDRVTDIKQLFAPASFPATAYDLVDIDEGQYEIMGQSTDFIHGPWWNPGVVMFQIRRVTG